MVVLSVNQMAWRIAQEFIDNPEFYGVAVSKSTAGAAVVDAGVKAPGGFQAGKKLTEHCMGGAEKVSKSLIRNCVYPKTNTTRELLQI